MITMTEQLHVFVLVLCFLLGVGTVGFSSRSGAQTPRYVCGSLFSSASCAHSSEIRDSFSFGPQIRWTRRTGGQGVSPQRGREESRSLHGCRCRDRREWCVCVCGGTDQNQTYFMFSVRRKDFIWHVCLQPGQRNHGQRHPWISLCHGQHWHHLLLVRKRSTCKL